MQTSHASQYFQFRRARDGKAITIPNWPKLGLAVEPHAHLVLGATAGAGCPTTSASSHRCSAKR